MKTDRMSLPLNEADPQIAAAIDNEVRRQHEGLELIASENFVSEAVLEAMGSVFTNKYAEGYPASATTAAASLPTWWKIGAGAGQEAFRSRTRQRAASRRIAGQHGSLCRGAAARRYHSRTQPGPRRTPDSRPSSEFFRKDLSHRALWGDQGNETIDYDDLEKLAEKEQPKLIIGGGSAYPRIIDFARMRQIADKVGALYLVDMAHFAGLVAGGVHPSPVPHAHIVTTTTHKTLRGPRAGMILSKQEFATAIDKVVFPGMQGGPLVHIIAAKAVSFLEAMQPRISGICAADRGQRQSAGGGTLAAEGFRIISGGTDTHLMLVDVFSKGILGSEAEKGPGRGRYYGQQERHSLRHQSAHEAERHPHRHPRADHPRHEGRQR